MTKALRGGGGKAALGGWALCAVLAGALLLLIAAGNLLLGSFPSRLEIWGDGTGAVVAVDGSSRLLSLDSPLRAVRFPPAESFRREYQVDGSDGTNSLNLDPVYFTAISSTPYYRFQAFLRDEGSYSRWRRLEIRDAAGQSVGGGLQAEGGAEIELPEPFSLSAELYRLEVPRTVQLLDASDNRFQIEINRNDRYWRVTELATGSAPREVMRSYFPEDWRPPAAEIGYLLTRVTALALALVLLVVAIGAVVGWLARLPAWEIIGVPRLRRDARVPGWKSAAIQRMAAALPWLAAAVALVGGSYSAVALFDRAPHILDAVSYYFQGKLLASGALAAPAPPVPEAFPTPFTVVHDGGWFSQYPPGAPLVLAAGFLLGVPWLMEPLLAAAATLLVYGIGCRQYGGRIALLAALLMATSPFLALQAGSFMSHVPAMFFITLYLYAATRYLEAPAKGWALVGALGLGSAFLTRESSALMYGLPVGLYVAAKVYGHHREGALRDLGIVAATLATFGVAYMLYNWALTGSPLLPPRGLFFGGDRFGFGTDVGFYGRHNLAAGLVNADELLTSLTLYLFGWPFYFSVALIALPFLLGRATVWDRLHGLVFGLYVVAYVGYFYHGIALGPRYYFEALPSLALLAARGFVVLAGRGGSILNSFTGQDSQRYARFASTGLLVALMGCNLLYFWPRQMELYHGFTGLPGGKGPELGDFVQRGLVGRTVEVPNALITTDDWWVYSVYLAPLNSPSLDSNAVLALIRGRKEGDRLRAAYPGRDLYRVVLDRNGKLSLAREGAPGAAGQ